MTEEQLPQIKLFWIGNSSLHVYEKKVNDYIVDYFNREGNYPEVHTNSKYICVVANKLVDTNKPPRKIPDFNERKNMLKSD